MSEMDDIQKRLLERKLENAHWQCSTGQECEYKRPIPEGSDCLGFYCDIGPGALIGIGSEDACLNASSELVAVHLEDVLNMYNAKHGLSPIKRQQPNEIRSGRLGKIAMKCDEKLTKNMPKCNYSREQP